MKLMKTEESVVPKVGTVYISKPDPTSDLMWIHIAAKGSNGDYVSGPCLCFNRSDGRFYSLDSNSTIAPNEYTLIWQPE